MPAFCDGFVAVWGMVIFMPGKIIVPLLTLIIVPFIVWLFCAGGCEYRNYSGGHLFFKAFRAGTPFQKFLTAFQSTKDIYPQDIGMLSIPGYVVSVLAAISGAVIIPLCAVMYFRGNVDFCIRVGGIWAASSSGGGLIMLILQVLDSLAARLPLKIHTNCEYSQKPIHGYANDKEPPFPGWIFGMGFIVLLSIVSAAILFFVSFNTVEYTASNTVTMKASVIKSETGDRNIERYFYIKEIPEKRFEISNNYKMDLKNFDDLAKKSAELTITADKEMLKDPSNKFVDVYAIEYDNKTLLSLADVNAANRTDKTVYIIIGIIAGAFGICVLITTIILARR